VNVSEFTLWGLGGAVLVPVIVQFLKAIITKDGETLIKDRWAVIASVGVGLALSGVAYWASQAKTVDTVVGVIGAGLLAGLAASGIFSLTKTRP